MEANTDNDGKPVDGNEQLDSAVAKVNEEVVNSDESGDKNPPSEEESSESRGDAGSKKRRGGFQKKIEKRDNRIAELEREIQSIKSKFAESTQESPKEPRLDDYDSYEDFVSAKSRYEAERLFDIKLAEREAKSKELDNQRRFQEKVRKYRESEDAARERFEDFDEVIQGFDYPTSQILNNAILDSDMGPDVAYHLAQNPELVEKLNGMGEGQVYREIAKLESKLSTSGQGKSAVVVTKAPPPINPVSSKKSSGTFDWNSDFTLEDFREARKKGIIR